MNIIIKDKEAIYKLLQPIYGKIYSLTSERDSKIKEETEEFLTHMEKEYARVNAKHKKNGTTEVKRYDLVVYNNKMIEEKTERIMGEYEDRIDKRVALIESLKYAIDYEFVDSISLTKDEMEMINDNSNMWAEYKLLGELSNKRPLEKYEETFIKDFNYWDNVDCSEYGLCLIWAKYLIGVANATGYFYQDYESIIEKIDEIIRLLK